jgi:hypothetical protein
MDPGFSLSRLRTGRTCEAQEDCGRPRRADLTLTFSHLLHLLVLVFDPIARPGRSTQVNPHASSPIHPDVDADIDADVNLASLSFRYTTTSSPLPVSTRSLPLSPLLIQWATSPQKAATTLPPTPADRARNKVVIRLRRVISTC